MTVEKNYTPALGHKQLTRLYDFTIAMLTRERKWRKCFVRQISPTSGDRLVDVGCGTGSLAILLKKSAPDARVFGVDPDPAILARAEKKSGKYGFEIGWRSGFLTDELTEELRPVTKVVSSLVFHQTPLVEKQHILDNAHRLLELGGELHIADYGLQRSKIMRFLFRWTVQAIDGIKDTQPNADGILPQLMEKAGFIDVLECMVVPTLTGSISLYRATRK